MEIVVNGLFDLSKNKTYVVLDSKKNEIGTFEVKNEELFIKLNDEKSTKYADESEVMQFLNENGYILATESWRWIEYNPNPLKNKVSDCTLRAYCAAERLEWDQAYDVACETGKSMSMMPNDDKCVHEILEKHFDYEYQRRSREEKDLTVKKFAIAHPEGTYILKVSRHVVAVIDGEYYDSWDSGNKKVLGWWQRSAPVEI